MVFGKFSCYSEDEAGELSGQKKLEHHNEARNKQTFWKRVESFSVSLKALQLWGVILS